MVSHAAPSVYQSTQCIFTAGTIEAGSSQAKRRPMTALRNKEFIHRVDIVAANEGWSEALDQLIQRTTPATHYRLKATLGQILEKEFFTEFVKTGNVSMLSEGNAVSGNTFSLCNGQLKLYLDKETYERSGLSGRLDERSGNRETRSKWLVTYDLQSASMQHGKRGFDRLVYGCKAIAEQSLNWICVLKNPSNKSTLLDKFPHTKVTSVPTVPPTVQLQSAVSQSSGDLFGEDQRGNRGEMATELYEWLSLVRLGSPRILPGDNIDPYISRYSLPECQGGQTAVQRISWEGLLSSSWVSDLASALFETCPAESWVAISATDVATSGLSGRGEVVILKQPGKDMEYLMWDIKHSM